MRKRVLWPVAILMAVLMAAGVAPPALAQPAPSQTQGPIFQLQLFAHVFRLIAEEALTPPPYPTLLQAAVEGLGRTLVAHGVQAVLPPLEISGNPRQDVQAAVTRLQQALELVPADIQPVEVIYGAIKAMVEAVNEPNTIFLTPAETPRFGSGDGSFVGVGIVLGQQGDRVVIEDVLEDSPAARAGVLPGDVIVSVDGQPTAGRTLAQVREMIVGPEGGTVTLGLLRPASGQTLSIPITRARIRVQAVSGRMIAPEVGYLRLAQFTRGTADVVGATLRRLRDEGARGLVIDLRGNPGGLLGESIDVASYFLQEGLVITTREAQDRTTTFLVRPREPKFGGPTVVLINRGSASASEVVAGALQDAGVKLIGERSFGKATIQSVHEFRDGSGLRLTVGRYLTRSGRDIRGQGLSPDITVALVGVLGAPEDAQLQRAIQVITDMMRGTAMAVGF